MRRWLTVFAFLVAVVAISGCAGFINSVQERMRENAARQSTETPVASASPSTSRLPDAVATPSPESLVREHGAEAEFTGTVTWNGEEIEDQYKLPCGLSEGCVMVDGTAVFLSLISPYRYSCADLSLTEEQQAEADRVKRELIPVGTQVRVVVDEEKYREGIETVAYGIIFPAGSAQPEDPRADSFNELLVESGYWVPDYTLFELPGYRAYTDLAAKYEARIPGSIAATPFLTAYVPYILEAADSTRVAGEGGQAVCLAATMGNIAEAAELEQQFAENRERTRIWWEQWTRDNPGWNTCRDGDGDGICYER